MQIVIKMSEEDYRKVKDGRASVSSMRDAIRNGTPLPKGHGRLIDADKYLQKVCTYKDTGCGSCDFQGKCITDAPTIIEADKESGGEQCRV